MQNFKTNMFEEARQTIPVEVKAQVRELKISYVISKIKSRF